MNRGQQERQGQVEGGVTAEAGPAGKKLCKTRVKTLDPGCGGWIEQIGCSLPKVTQL